MSKLRYILLILLCGFLLQSSKLNAQEQRDSLSDDFVIASIVITDPGEVLYSRVGHAFLRMQCPEHNLDFCFSYESEDVRNKVLSFLAGKLKMGLTAIPTQEYLQSYKAEGRGVYQYDLNLPIKVKQNLWRVLDEEKAKGMMQDYDYLDRGCAISVLHFIQHALGKESMDFGKWTEDIERLNRRELLFRRMDDDPWTRLAINFLANGSSNDDLPNHEKLVTPRDLVEQLQHVKVCERTLLSGTPKVLVPSTCASAGAGWFTPTVLALILLVITVVCAFLGCRWWDYVLLVIQTLLGIGTVYLVCFSSLCATEWSWLIIPFNPLPLLLWKWRRWWCLPYAAILIVWVLYMCLAPHSLTDTAFIILTATIILNYLFFKKQTLFINLLKKQSL